MDNQTEVSSFVGREPRPSKPVEAKKPERVSILDWMAQTLDEMKRRTGWFKQDPEVTRIQRLSAPYPEIQASVSQQIERLHRRADIALQEAEAELASVRGEPKMPVSIIEAPAQATETKQLPIEQPYRLIRIKNVDPGNREAWNERTFELIQEYDTAFGKGTTDPRTNDFEVTTLAPTSGITLRDVHDRGARSIRVRSESVGGVRVDGIIDSNNPTQWSEFRVYETSGHYTTVPGTQDPVDTILHYAKINAYGLRYTIQAQQERGRRNRVVFGEYRSGSQADQQLTSEAIVRAQNWRLALPIDYERESAAKVRPAPTRQDQSLPPEPAIGVLKGVPKGVRREPAIGPLPNGASYDFPEPTLKPRDEAFEKLKAAYGLDVALRLEDHMFANQEDFDAYYKSWESATRNLTLPPEQAAFVQKVFAALQIEGKAKKLLGQGSYGYVVESYKNIESNLPKLKESISTVWELIKDLDQSIAEKKAQNLTESVAKDVAQQATFHKELKYLYHLKMRCESEQNVSLHAQIERFIDSNQQKFTLMEIREITEAERALDAAQGADVEPAKAKLMEVLDYPARVVLADELTIFLDEYDRFMKQSEKEILDQRIDDIWDVPGTINYWAQQKMQTDFLGAIRNRAWETIARESLDRLSKSLHRDGHVMSGEAFAIVSKLRDQLSQAVPKHPGEKMDLRGKFRMENIFQYYEPVPFERYLTTLLTEATGKDMRPEREKSNQEVSVTEKAVEPQINTFVHEPARAEDTMVLEPVTPTAVEAEWETEDVTEEIPGLVRALRGVRTTPEEAAAARLRGRQILEQAGSEELIKITVNMLGHLDQLRNLKRIDERTYSRALATLLNTDTIQARNAAFRTLSMELPTTFLHPDPHPAVGEFASTEHNQFQEEEDEGDQRNIA